MTSDLPRRHFFRQAGAAAAGIVAAPILDLRQLGVADAAGPSAAAAILPGGGDDTPAIQAALNATGTAELGRGTFKLSQLRMSSGQQLIMSMQTVVQGIAGTRPVELIAVVDADDVRIEGGILTGTGQAGCRGIGVFGGRRVTVRGTRAVNMAAGGGGGHGFFVGTSFSRTSESILFDAVSAANNTAAGILLAAGQRIEIVDAEIVDTTGTGSGILVAPSGPWDAVGQLVVRGCELARNQHGARFLGPSVGKVGAISIVGNRIQSNRSRGIDASTRSEDGFLVDGNVIASNGGEGIVVELVSNGARVVDNEIRDNGGVGIRLRTSQRWEVRGNHVIRQRGAGIVVHPGTATGTGENYGLVSHNQLWDNSKGTAQAEGGIRVEGTTGQKPSVSVIGNWYGNFVTPATQRCGVLNVGPFDRTTVVLQNNRATGHPELVNI
jgi:hypothetical protein